MAIKNMAADRTTDFGFLSAYSRVRNRKESLRECRYANAERTGIDV